MTSTFPRWLGDHEPPFVYELSRRLCDFFKVSVIAPHAPSAGLEEDLAGLQVLRFRYAPISWQQLAYEGGILAKLRQNKLRHLLVPLFLLAELGYAVKFLRRNKIQVVHAHWIIPQGLIAIIARWFTQQSFVIICTAHGGDLFGLQGRIWFYLKRWILKRCQVVTVVSRAMKTEMLSLDIDDRRISIIPMGVDTRQRFVPCLDKRQPMQLLFVGRLVEKKGLSVLLQSLPLVIRLFPKLTLNIVGSGPENVKLQQEVASAKNLQDHVVFHGSTPQQELPVFYQSTTLVIFPSIIAQDGDQEGLGLVLVEALSCGCCVIASDLPAVRDVIEDGVTGCLTPPGDSVALAEKIIYLLNHPHDAQKLGMAGRRYVSQQFDWSFISEKYHQLITLVSQLDANAEPH